MGNIKYLEEKFYKSKSAITAKLMERRREDVRDQGPDLNDVYTRPNAEVVREVA